MDDKRNEYKRKNEHLDKKVEVYESLVSCAAEESVGARVGKQRRVKGRGSRAAR